MEGYNTQTLMRLGEFWQQYVNSGKVSFLVFLFTGLTRDSHFADAFYADMKKAYELIQEQHESEASNGI